jgi:hypothetical protein
MFAEKRKVASLAAADDDAGAQEIRVRVKEEKVFAGTFQQ